MSYPVADDDRQARPGAGSALEIVHAQYHRALALAASGEPAERAVALAEARRLVKVAVELRGAITDRDAVEVAASVPAERHVPGLRNP
jgi:hypothetical protein